ncbi:MAG: transglutaminase family protein [Gammaproteobacteria bacterium]|nr:transglutaminase family protein [Gammaproteobacteria bacterium]
MRVRASCELELHLAVATPLILMLRPQSGVSQWISSEEYTFSHPVSVVEYSDIFGNLCQRLVAPAVEFKINTSAIVETADVIDQFPGAPFVNVQDLPEQVLAYLVPTRYCESDRLGAAAKKIVSGARLGYDQVDTITSWIRDNFPFTPGSSDVPLSAVEVQKQGYGVCRDLAHLGIAYCRSISIPARMVVGYLYGLEPMDLHAWFEAYVGNRWYTFDSSQEELKGGRVAIAYGRDAADCSIFHQFGPLPTYNAMRVSVDLMSN